MKTPLLDKYNSQEEVENRRQRNEKQWEVDKIAAEFHRNAVHGIYLGQSTNPYKSKEEQING